MVLADQNPESIRMVSWPLAPARRTRPLTSSMNLAGGVGPAGPLPSVQHLAAIGPGGQQRMIAEPMGVAVGGALLW
jgi:hypothetical protein